MIRPYEILDYLTAAPFRPFRINMVSGRTYEVRHPELVRVMPNSFIYFTPSAEAGLYDLGEMMGSFVE